MNVDEGWHTCHFCGADIDKDGYESSGRRGVRGKRHWLSDCRPDLVEHEIGELCTWAFRRDPKYKRLGNETEDFLENHTCYAYQDRDLSWRNEHKYFYPDGPM